MNTALHLAYRPQTLDDLVGQVYTQRTLRNAIALQRIAPAYLFTGPRGTGKTSTARIFAKSLNCLSDGQTTLTPCGECQSCRSIEVSNSLDVTEIDAASHNGVDDARELTQRVNFAPVLGRYRIILLDEAQMLTSQAQNALLKCIEEPPNHVVFILCTTEAHRVLPTITSRCQRFEFRALSVKTIVKHLRSIANQEAIRVQDEALVAIARLCEGGLRDALQLLSQARLLDDEVTASQIIEMAGGVTEADLLQMINALSHHDTFALLQTARHLIDSGKSPKLILSSLLQVYRDILIVQADVQQSTLLTSSISRKHLAAIANRWSHTQIQAALAQLQTSEGQLRFSPNAQIWLEVCLLNLIPTGSAPIPSLSQKSQHNGNGENAVARIWQTVIENASDNAKSLLRNAQLQSFDGHHAVLTVDANALGKFEANQSKIAQMIQRSAKTKQAITVTFRVTATAV
ncbi:DNA polymerase III subunit gamma/tau [Leptolyngbya sp. AN03gr2]|uniref:DNA polymerase III subunit gamma/tau n=1 Tax=unclassified Leptolyngbya TaxID=2650499 RepID=UPI003D31C648